LDKVNQNLIEEEDEEEEKKSDQKPFQMERDENELDMDLEGEFTIEEILENEDEANVIGEK
jgi:hypothetical protein